MSYNPTTRRRIQRIVKKCNPQRLNVGVNVHTIEELGKFLETNKDCSYFKYGDNAHRYSLRTGIDTWQFQNHKKEITTAVNIYFFDEEFISQLCPFKDLIIVDATFDTVPKLQNNKNMQFLTVMAKITSNENSKVLLFIMASVTDVTFPIVIVDDNNFSL